jgi:hypothetical protein
MKIGHLSKVLEKRVSNIARRQKKQSQDNAHYGKADSVWELMNPEELKIIRKEEKAGMKEAKRRLARKMVRNPDAEMSSEEEEATGNRVIVDFADIERAKRELAAAANLGEDCEEDTLADLAPVAPSATARTTPTAASFAGPGFLDGGGQGGLRDSALPPRGALVYPVGSPLAIAEAIGQLRANQTLWVEQGRHQWQGARKSEKDKAIEFEEQRMRSLMDWDYEPIDDRASGRLIYDEFLHTYHALDPIRPTYLPSVFQETTDTLREVLPRISGLDSERFLHINRANTHLRGAPSPDAERLFPIRQLFPLTKMRGQWLLAANSSGSVCDMLVLFYR